MNYPTSQLEKDIQKIIADLAQLRADKGADYASVGDTFSDLRPLGVDYCLKRIIQKCFRALNLLDKPPAVKTDKLDAEFGDIINFSLYCPILWEQIENEKKNESLC